MLDAAQRNRFILAPLPPINPYGIGPGTELDTLIHHYCFDNTGETLPYSSDPKAADKVRARMKEIHGFPVATGQTRLRSRPCFARLESGPSTATEVIAETTPLAICRLALVVSLKQSGS